MAQPPANSGEYPDDQSCVLYLEVPASKVVLLQAYYELYEGVGIVRTLDISSGLVSILTTSCLLADCLEVLDSIQEKTLWRFASPSHEAKRVEYM